MREEGTRCLLSLSLSLGCRRRLLLLLHAVAADDAGVVPLEGLEGDLLGRLELVGLQLLHLLSEHRLRRHRRVNAVSLPRVPTKVNARPRSYMPINSIQVSPFYLP